MPRKGSRRPDIQANLDEGLAGGHECVWWRSRLDRSGYGQICYGGGRNVTTVHRAVWLMAGREIPEGLTIDHACHKPDWCGPPCPHRSCINVDHLRLATHHEQNLNRWWPSGHQFNETCGRGHPWSEDNTYVRPSGQVSCKACVRISKHAYHARLKERRIESEQR